MHFGGGFLQRHGLACCPGRREGGLIELRGGLSPALVELGLFFDIQPAGVLCNQRLHRSQEARPAGRRSGGDAHHSSLFILAFTISIICALVIGTRRLILNQSIPVVWDTDNKCDGESCSLHYCYGKFCTYNDRKRGVASIYISLWHCNDLQSLVRTLAHEIYHRTEPFGSVPDTLFEEFNAYEIGARISGSDWPKFEGVDPLAPAQLDQWFKDNQFTVYPGLQSYPARIAQLVKNSEKAYSLPSLFHSQVTNPDGQSPK